MIAILSLILILTFSILVTRIATVALTLTGLSRESARFQARSAFTGVGFTTTESERVVQHPVRRRILLILMLLGNAGIVTVISSLILTFINVTGSGSFTMRIVFLSAGSLVLWILASSQWVDIYLSRAIDWALKRYTHLELLDYADLLQLSGEYSITELKVKPGGWLAHQTLGETELREEGILVLGIKRTNDSYVGAPNGTTKLLPHDTLIIYGRENSIKNLNIRGRNKIGDLDHDQAVIEQEKVIQKEKEENTVNEGE
jgi:hypothetical protein